MNDSKINCAQNPDCNLRNKFIEYTSERRLD